MICFGVQKLIKTMLDCRQTDMSMHEFEYEYLVASTSTNS